MKKTIVAITITITMTILIVYVFITYTAQVPDITVMHKYEKLDIVKCPLVWKSVTHAVFASYPSTDILAKSLIPIIVKPKSVLDLKFSRKPSEITVVQWNGTSKIYHNDFDKVIVPKEKGIYIFEVWGHWKQGEVFYIFKLKVV